MPNSVGGNGSSHDVPANTTSVRPDVDAAPNGKGSSRPSLLRRSKANQPEPDGSTDEFLDFLRGALVDDTPLGEASDSDLQWRWTR